MLKRLIYLALILLSFTACFNLNKISLYNLSGLYDNTLFTSLDAAVFNPEPMKGTVFLTLQMRDMAIEFDTINSRSYTKFSLKYELFRTYDSKDILDSATTIITDSSLRIADTNVKIGFDYPDRGTFILKLVLTDLNRVDIVNAYLHLDNTGRNSRESFLLLDDDEVVYSTNTEAFDEYKIQLQDLNADQAFVRYYHREFPLALPPFLEETNTTFNFNADSAFVVEVMEGKTSAFSLPQEGFYHFQIDSAQKAGYTLFRFYDGYPQVITAGQMLDPLRYITSKKEYENLKASEDVKLAIDNFWLENAGNSTRARAMIQKYYSRVVDANSYFTSYHEGWKTDRGLIYIVYGPPRIVYRGEDIEEWLYGEKGNSNSIRFQFLKVENPFTHNDYSLIKSPSYKEKWYNIVSTWRR